ncbi:LEAF RUST 10 DISEASE-RESISTANCE LOCUS RECEPTOR-LIKE PROTEIN KINASE-like 2.7 [Camellia lanceoleosa]|uniref:LEAF RUST 10 DISEASE-RESISTANCE LOCUS RECEPTOR-LIKE PROTEIN KINASE-like 2.7 n=1 Tax=Camellia lanceoleosa TaxID=1840588 RepID=A0ACC0HWF8_9ERIC|nr:LEAF RUST 10 DISEASE-RESISTANCE LOCUS RECEPTOR-LIKE PROTEIN KINASE-like 2.7 [Camellia lanceoleosa]
MIIILSQIPTFLCVENEQYANCSKVFQCTGIPDLGYPFWGGSRPDYCGHPRFGLNCTGDAPLITIQTRPYRVLTINDSTQILKVVREEFWENICTTEFINATVDNTPFTYISSQDLMLYYGCQRQSATTFPGQFDCTVEGTTNTVGFAVTAASTSLITALNMNVTSCHKVVSVKVDQTEATAFATSLTSNPTSVNVTQVLDSGVELQWDANNNICDQCIGSGGKCGSNTSSGLFACYCLDKPYELTCNTTQSGTGSTNRFNLGIKLTIADDKQYTNCTQLFQCENIPNLSYPFWGGNRPDYSGHPSFKLNCQGNAPLITIQTRPHRVLAIDNTAQILTAVRAEFWNNFCPAELHNATLDTAHFNYSSNTQDLMLYYGCQAPSNGVSPSQFACSVNGTNNTVGFVVNSVTSTSKVNVLTCQVRVRVRVNQRAAQALENSTSNVTQVLDTGFGLQWRANTTCCNQCVGSGGICGSNSTSGSFVCYCSTLCNYLQNWIINLFFSTGDQINHSILSHCSSGCNVLNHNNLLR